MKNNFFIKFKDQNSILLKNYYFNSLLSEMLT